MSRGVPPSNGTTASRGGRCASDLRYAIVLPSDQQPWYTEKIVHLPDCYQVNDSKRSAGVAVPSRADIEVALRRLSPRIPANTRKNRGIAFDGSRRAVRSLRLARQLHNADMSLVERQAVISRPTDPIG